VSKRGAAKPAKTIQRAVDQYPDVVVGYYVSDRKHVVKLHQGWRRTKRARTGRVISSHQIVVRTVADFQEAWRRVKPCECNKCIGADRGGALAIWRTYERLHLDWSRGALFADLIGRLGHREHLPLLSDEDLVAMDVALEKQQRSDP
jgi:hypothetical protein